MSCSIDRSAVYLSMDFHVLLCESVSVLLPAHLSLPPDGCRGYPTAIIIVFARFSYERNIVPLQIQQLQAACCLIFYTYPILITLKSPCTGRWLDSQNALAACCGLSTGKRLEFPRCQMDVAPSCKEKEEKKISVNGLRWLNTTTNVQEWRSSLPDRSHAGQQT